MIKYAKVDSHFYNRDTETVAKDLLGLYFVHYSTPLDIRIGKIVETEAYLGPADKAAHSSRGRTERTEVLYGPAGFIYVYLIYGMHYLVNLTTAAEGSAVLIRAIEPVQNIVTRTAGPGLVTRALGITKDDYGLSALGNRLFVAQPIPFERDFEIVSTKRIGVEYAEEWKDLPLRYYIKDNEYVSQR